MSRVLVVGGAGYVGGWLTDEVARHDNVEVRVIDNLSYEDAFLKPVSFYFCDVTDFKSLEPHLEWADTVVWLAAIVGDPACALNPKRTFEVNTKAVRNLTEAFGGRIIFTSTCSVYGAQDDLLTEQSPLNPLSAYAESKIQAEEILREANANALILRLGTLFGLGDPFSRVRADLVLNLLTARAVIEGEMTIYGGRQSRPLLHVRDVATAITPHLFDSVEGTFNLHCENITILELAERIQAVVKGSSISLSEKEFEDRRNYAVSGEKAKSILGFTPTLTPEDGILQIRNLVESRRIPNIGSPRFSNVALLSLKAASDV